MWGLKDVARNRPTGTVSRWLKYNNIRKLILYVLDVDEGSKNQIWRLIGKSLFCQ